MARNRTAARQTGGQFIPLFLVGTGLLILALVTGLWLLDRTVTPMLVE